MDDVFVRVLSVVSILIGLNACNSEGDTSVTMLLPEPLRQIAAVDTSEMFIRVYVNGGAAQQFNAATGGGNVVVGVSGIQPDEVNTIVVQWHERVGGREVILSEQTQEFFADGNTIIDAQHNYAFDDDGDGRNNWIERTDGTCVWSSEEQCIGLETGNLVENGDFTNLRDGWFHSGGSEASYLEGEYCLSTSESDMFFYEGSIGYSDLLELPDIKYILTFDIKAEQNSTIQVSLARIDEVGAYTSLAEREVSVSTSYTTKRESIELTRAWDNVRLGFGFGNSQANRHCLDNVRLEIDRS